MRTSLWQRAHRACRRSSLRWPSCSSRSRRAAASCWLVERPCSRSISPAAPPTIWTSSPRPSGATSQQQRDELEAAARQRGWSVERIQDSGTFCRLIIRSGTAERLADLAVDAPPDHPGSVTIAGPTFDPEELAGRKLLALFDRAAARDFVDVYLLAQRFPKDLLLARAAEVDAGFDTLVLAEMIATLARFTDADMPLPGESVPALRAFCEDWHSELTA